MAAQVVWLERWTGGTNAAPLAKVQSLKGFPAIRDPFAASHRALQRFTASLTEETLDAVLHYTDSRGAPHNRVTWQLMVHLVNHGTHHRSEICMALTAAAHEVRELDSVFFESERDP